jgi:hypothetical protein
MQERQGHILDSNNNFELSSVATAIYYQNVVLGLVGSPDIVRHQIIRQRRIPAVQVRGRHAILALVFEHAVSSPSSSFKNLGAVQSVYLAIFSNQFRKYKSCSPAIGINQVRFAGVLIGEYGLIAVIDSANH